MRDTPEIAAARIAAEVAKTRLFTTAEELQERLSPKTLAREPRSPFDISDFELGQFEISGRVVDAATGEVWDICCSN